VQAHKGGPSLAAAALSFLLTLGAGAGAGAHGLARSWTQVWSDGRRCLNESVSVSHGSYGSGRFVAAGKTRERSSASSTCTDRWKRRAGRIKARAYVLKRLTDGSPALCFDTGWRKSSRRAAGWEVSVTGPSSGRPLCGKGRYKTLGRVAVRYRGTWHGGSMSTRRWHALPRTTGVAVGKATLWTSRAGGTNPGARALLPGFVPTLNCSGNVVGSAVDPRTSSSGEGYVPCASAANGTRSSG
jgi:hypothetical protein